jgi:hypothetical protein
MTRERPVDLLLQVMEDFNLNHRWKVFQCNKNHQQRDQEWKGFFD